MLIISNLKYKIGTTNMRDQLDTLFKKEMSRKEFLQHIGAGVMILFGLSGLIKALTQHQTGGRGHSVGYGASAYGGGTKR
jgi:hypothetical protein